MCIGICSQWHYYCLCDVISFAWLCHVSPRPEMSMTYYTAMHTICWHGRHFKPGMCDTQRLACFGKNYPTWSCLLSCQWSCLEIILQTSNPTRCWCTQQKVFSRVVPLPFVCLTPLPHLCAIPRCRTHCLPTLDAFRDQALVAAISCSF